MTFWSTTSKQQQKKAKQSLNTVNEWLVRRPLQSWMMCWWENSGVLEQGCIMLNTSSRGLDSTHPGPNDVLHLAELKSLFGVLLVLTPAVFGWLKKHLITYRLPPLGGFITNNSLTLLKLNSLYCFLDLWSTSLAFNTWFRAMTSQN